MVKSFLSVALSRHCAHCTFYFYKTYTFRLLGNGPSAITLSYLLSGHWPYYKGMDELGHPPDFLHARLESKSDTSLVLQDLQELSEVIDRSHCCLLK